MYLHGSTCYHDLHHRSHKLPFKGAWLRHSSFPIAFTMLLLGLLRQHVESMLWTSAGFLSDLSDCQLKAFRVISSVDHMHLLVSFSSNSLLLWHLPWLYSHSLIYCKKSKFVVILVARSEEHTSELQSLV